MEPDNGLSIVGNFVLGLPLEGVDCPDCGVDGLEASYRHV